MTLTPVVVELAAADHAEALHLATREADRFRGRAGPYGGNRPEAHLTGKLGEVAVHRWAQRLGVRAVPLFRFQSFTRGADVTAGGVPIEVKAYRQAAWERLGGCVSTYQLEAILSKAAMIIFCRVPDGPAPRYVELVGWLPAGQVPTLSDAHLDITLRANLRVPESSLQRIWSLTDRLSDADDGAAPELLRASGSVVDPSGRCPVGHSTFYGHCWGCLHVPFATPDRVTVSAAARAHMHLFDQDELSVAHGGWPFLTGTSRPRFINVVFRHQPCPICFASRPSMVADPDALGGLESSEGS